MFEQGQPRSAKDAEQQDDEGGHGKHLICARCRHRITTDDQRVDINDEHEHFFVNPHGYDYHIGCFATAPGATATGKTTGEWTWFSGYTWQLEHCRNCSSHLGWMFRSPSKQFHGLILDRLSTEEDE